MAEELKRNGRKVKEPRKVSLAGVHVKGEEEPREGQEKRQRQESSASWQQSSQDPEKTAFAFTWS